MISYTLQDHDGEMLQSPVVFHPSADAAWREAERLFRRDPRSRGPGWVYAWIDVVPVYPAGSIGCVECSETGLVGAELCDRCLGFGVTIAEVSNG